MIIAQINNKTINLSNRGYTTLSTDSLPNTIFDPFNFKRPQFEHRLFNRDSGVFNVSLPSWGGLQINTDYKDIDNISKGDNIIISQKLKSGYSNFTEIFRGKIQEIQQTEDYYVLRLQSIDLSALISSNEFGGTNTDAHGIDGHPGDDIVGQKKPRCYGYCFPEEGIEPVLVNKAGEIYMVEGYDAVQGDWQLWEITGSGVWTQWTYEGNATSESNFNTSLPTSGAYFKSHNARGVMRLGSVPPSTSRLVVRLKGAMSGTDKWTHYDVIKKILDDESISNSFSSAFQNDTGYMGFYCKNKETTIMDVLAQVLPATRGYIYETDSGDYDKVLNIDKWNLPTTFIELETIRINNLKRINLKKINVAKMSYATFHDLTELASIGDENETEIQKYLDNSEEFTEEILDNIVTESDLTISNGCESPLIKSNYMEKAQTEYELRRIFDIVSLGGKYINFEYYINILPVGINSGVTVNGNNYVVTGIQSTGNFKNKIYARSV